MDNLPTPPRAKGHAWWPTIDLALQAHVWTCTCGEIVYQPFDSPVPDALISHPQEHGQLRGDSSPPANHRAAATTS